MAHGDYTLPPAVPSPPCLPFCGLSSWSWSGCLLTRWPSKAITPFLLFIPCRSTCLNLRGILPRPGRGNARADHSESP